jgi:hypothetical protein
MSECGGRIIYLAADLALTHPPARPRQQRGLRNSFLERVKDEEEGVEKNQIWTPAEREEEEGAAKKPSR